LLCLFNCFFRSGQPLIPKQSSPCFLVENSPIDSLKINKEDLPKYREAYNYILSDSINKRRDIFVSDTIVDMDRFYFKSDVQSDSILAHIINSLTKYYWFDDFFSCEIKELFGEQNKKAESILFFSLIEKNTLRVDLFVKRYSINDFKYDWIINSNRDKVYAYLFFFDKIGKIKYVYRHEITYGI
jgi:hypothetical protein